MTNAERSLTGSWLAQRLAVDPVRIEAMRRAGELVAVRPDGSFDWYYPAWQFGSDGKVLPPVRRALEAARAAGVNSARLAELLERRTGMVGGGVPLRELLLRGDVDRVVGEIRRAA